MTEGEEANFLHAIQVYFPCISYGYFPVDPSAVLPSRLVKTSRVGGFRSTERERFFASSRLLCLIRQPINSPMTSGTSSPVALTPLLLCREQKRLPPHRSEGCSIPHPRDGRTDLVKRYWAVAQHLHASVVSYSTR